MITMRGIAAARRVAVIAMLAATIFAPVGLPSEALAQTQPEATACASNGQALQFILGFGDLKVFIGRPMGDPTTCESADPRGTGDVHQTTTTGLAFWRKSTNTPTFTNGNQHWAHTTEGWLCWTGDAIDPPAGSRLCDSRDRIGALAILTPPAALPPFDRAQWGDWIDQDRDCQNTRTEVLIAESRAPVTFRGTSQCMVVDGLWLDPYTGGEFTQASSLDIDHVVPLANAYRSGGWSWDSARRVQYANYLDDPVHLVAVSAATNRSKGDRGPDEWRPPDRNDWCAYAQNWVEVKLRWDLSATSTELDALNDMLGTCNSR